MDLIYSIYRRIGMVIGFYLFASLNVVLSAYIMKEKGR